MSAETELNAVKKIEANKYCVNCDAYNKFGHGNICEKFKTFVCSNCKSAHQSFSMRVKSVSMSNWSKDEVDALREENGGGNAVAKRIWLGKWDESQMRKPTDKDHVDYFKKFINRVYNDRAFYDENPAAAAPQPRKDVSSGSSSQRRASPPPPAASANLLDFAAPAAASTAPTFDAFGSSSSASSDWASSSSTSTAAPAAVATSPGSDGWGAFASAPASSTNDGFGDFAAFSAAPPAPAAAPAQAFDPFGASAFASPAPVQPVSFDPFGASSSSSSAFGQTSSSTGFGQFGAAAPALVMASGPPPGKNLSAFDELAAPNLAYGGHPHGQRYGQQQQQHFGHQTPQHMGGSGFYQQPTAFQQQQQPGTHMMGANSAANISAFMNPHAQQMSYSSSGSSGNGYARPAQSGGRDPFAGLGLPQH